MNDFLTGLKITFNPKNVIKELVTFSKATTIVMIVMLLAEILTFGVQADFRIVAWMGLLRSFFTVFNLVLIDQGRITNYFWGAINCAVSLYVSLENRLIGDIASQIFYFVFQFVGIYYWHKQMNEQSDGSDEVDAKKITPLKALLAILGVIVLYIIVLMTSKQLHGNQVYIDSLLLPLGVVGQILMTYGYASQWYAWIAINVINVYIWVIQLHNGGAAALSMVVLQVIMLINSIYGCYLWYRKS